MTDDTVQVPREATEEMIDAGEIVRLDEGWAKTIWRAMCAAAPQATDPRDADLMRQELNAISAAIGTVRFMDPPDGGDVSLAEQVTRMREALDKAEEWNRLRAQDIVTLGHLAGQTLDTQAENEKLRAALERIMVGGNHVALLIGADHPPAGTDHDKALHHYGAGDQYEAWCCWNTIMLARAAISPPPLSPEKP